MSTPASTIRRRVSGLWSWTYANILRSEFEPQLPDEVDSERLVGELSAIFGLDKAAVRDQLTEYKAFTDQMGYSATLGERKTLSWEEAFVFYFLLSRYRPGTFVEIGTQKGRSTRRIVDAKNRLGLETSVYCYDVVDLVEFFQPDEATLMLKDVTTTVRSEVLDRFEPGIIFLDAHPYHLLQNVITEVVRHPKPWILVVHDCTPGLCNPRMSRDPSDLNISSKTGHWERHVLAKIFGVQDPMSSKLNRLETATHRLDVLSTPHGIALILPKKLLAA